MGTVMLAAFLEWFLWLAAFLYCLIKVFQKAEHWTIRILAVIMIIAFTALRYRALFSSCLDCDADYHWPESSFFRS